MLIGLAYIARQESAGQAVADVAATGRLVGQGKSRQEREAIKVSKLPSAVFVSVLLVIFDI